jgi:hypothetical protein
VRFRRRFGVVARREASVNDTLQTLVVRLADEPTSANQKAFYRGLVESEVFVPLQEVPEGAMPGPQVADGWRPGIPTAPGPNNEPMLVVYTDRPAALQFHKPWRAIH